MFGDFRFGEGDLRVTSFSDEGHILSESFFPVELEQENDELAEYWDLIEDVQ